MSTFALMMAVLAALASLGVAVSAWLATLGVGDEVSLAGFKLTLTDEDGAAVTERHRARPDHISPSQLLGQP